MPNLRCAAASRHDVRNGINIIANTTIAGPGVRSPLFSPINLGVFTLPNRIAMAPMTRGFASNGVLVADVPAYYRRRVEGGTPLIVTEGTAVPHAVAHQAKNIPHFYGEAAIARWREVVDAVHGAGGRIFPQLWHCGIGRHREETANPEELSIGPSIVGKQPMRVMTQRDIDDVVNAFGQGAATAKEADLTESQYMERMDILSMLSSGAGQTDARMDMVGIWFSARVSASN